MSTEGPWIKAAASGGQADCVEMRHRPGGGVEVRDSKNPDGPVLSYTPSEWEAWLDGAKKGEFDNLA